MFRLSPLLIILALLSTVSCVTESKRTESKRTLLYSVQTVNENIIGFFGDSSIMIREIKYQSDYYEADGDTVIIGAPIVVAKVYHYGSRQYGDSANFPLNSSLIVRGKSLDYDSNGSIYRFDIESRRRFYVDVNGGPENPGSLSDDGEILYSCREGISKITHIPTGVLLYSDSNGVGQIKPCTGYGIVGKKPVWHMFNSFSNPISYRTIELTGVSPWIETSDRFNGYYMVRDVGFVPYIQIVAGGSVAVPTYLDPDGRLTRIFNELRNKGIEYLHELDVERRLYITSNNVLSMDDSLPLYRARMTSDTIYPQ